MTISVIRGEEVGCDIRVGALVLPSSQAVDLSQKLSRGVQQRVARRCRVSQAVRNSMAALNSLGGFEDSEGVGNCAFSLSVRDRLQKLHQLNEPPPSFSVQEAASELLGHSVTPYGALEEASPVVPYARERVAWPKRGATGRHISEYFPDDLRLQFEGTDRSWVRRIEEVRNARREG